MILSFEKKESACESGVSAVKDALPLSVIICTYNRADLLSMVMDSLIHQTLPQDQFEIVVIDDGSLDGTRKVVQSFMDRLPIRYFYQHNAGLSSAKNHGIYASQGGILLFLDDDDSAAPTLLEEHIGTHREYPEENYAVLHYTTWAPDLPVTPLMHFVTEVGCFLFSYPYITHGDILDYSYFWGGRSSCKRSFLIEHGVFNPIFRFGCEDIELGYRLSKHGLRVVYNSRAKGMMIRPLAFDDFCRRLIKQGRSQYIFSRMHEEPAVQEWTEVTGAEEKWTNLEPVFEAKLRSARELDKIVTTRLKYGVEIDDLTKRLLERSYWWAFRACKLKAIVEARNEERSTAGQEALTARLEGARAIGDGNGSRTTVAVIRASDNRT